MGKTYKGLDSLTDAYKDYLDEAIEDEKKEVEVRKSFFESKDKTVSEKVDSKKDFVPKVKTNDAEAIKKVEEANVFDYIKTRTKNFIYEYILTSDLMFIKAEGKQTPSISGYAPNVVVEGEAVLAELRNKLNLLKNRMKNVNKLQMEIEELKEICKLGNKGFTEMEMKILKRTAVTELGPDKAGEVLGGNVVAEIVAENERYNAEQSK